MPEQKPAKPVERVQHKVEFFLGNVPAALRLIKFPRQKYHLLGLEISKVDVFVDIRLGRLHDLQTSVGFTCVCKEE